MKKLMALISVFCLTNHPIQLSAQDNPDVQLNASQYDNGYNVSCHGVSNGSIEAIGFGGNPPYAFLWSNGATTQNLSNIPAGVYTVTITDWSNYSSQRQIELSQPEQLEVNLFPVERGAGTNISEQGGSDGEIRSEIGGGSPPYTYLWSNGEERELIDDLVVGTYTLTVTDVNGCTLSNSVTLNEPSQLHIVSITSPLHHGYNISCRNGSDGVINLTVAGGVPPYQYQWNNGSMEQNPSDLIARIYMVRVSDGNGVEIIGQLSLTQPPALNVQLTPYVYSSNGYNVSSYGASNGSITTSVTGGVSPYTYQWETGQSTSNISNLGPSDYYLVVTDANGCETTNHKTLTQPEQDLWSRGGNAGTNPSNQFIGTTDAQDLSFRTNNIEQLRIKSNGNIKISSFSGTGDKFIYADNNGVLQSFNFKIIPPQVSQPCNANNYTYVPNVWQYDNSNYTNLFNCWQNFGVGTSNPQERLEVKGNVRFTNYQSSADYVSLGHDGGNARINSFGAGSLLINYSDNTSNYPTKNTYINTGSYSGDVYIGNINKIINLDAASIKLNNLNGNGGGNGLITIDNTGLVGRIAGSNNQVLLGNGTLANLSGINFWTLNANNDIYNNNSSGNVGIGTNSPSQKLEVMNGIGRFSNDGTCNGCLSGTTDVSFDGAHGRIESSGDLLINYSSNKNVIIGGSSRLTVGGPDFILGTNDGRATNSTDGLALVHDNDDVLDINYNTSFEGGVRIDGNVGIGVLPDNTVKLKVCGKVGAKEFEVKLSWCDFVFDKNYKRMSFDEQENYFKEHRHLPYLASGKEIEKDGLKIGETMQGFIQNLEETRLDVIDLYRMIKELRQENINLKEEITKLRSVK